MKKYFSITNMLTAIALTTIIPMFFSCYSQTQIVDEDSLALGFQFTYYGITAVTTGSENINFAVHFQVGVFLVDVVIAYLVVCVVVGIAKKIKTVIAKE